MFLVIEYEQFAHKEHINMITVFHNAAPGININDLKYMLFSPSENRRHTAMPYTAPLKIIFASNNGIPIQLSAPAAENTVHIVAAAVR